MEKNISASPSWSNEDADDFWDDDIEDLDSDFIEPPKPAVQKAKSAPKVKVPEAIDPVEDLNAPVTNGSHEPQGAEPEAELEEKLEEKHEPELEEKPEPELEAETEPVVPPEIHTAETEAPIEEITEIEATEKEEPVVEEVPSELQPAVDPSIESELPSNRSVDVKEPVVSEVVPEPEPKLSAVENLDEALQDSSFLIEKSLDTQTADPEPSAKAPLVPESMSNGLSSETQDKQGQAQIDSVDSDAQHANGHSSEVVELKKEIELLKLQLQQSPSGDDALLQKLAETEQERDQAKQQMDVILRKVSGMKTLFENYKTTQNELEDVKQTLSQVTEEKQKVEESFAKLTEEKKAAEGERAQAVEEKSKLESEKLKLTETVKTLQTESTDLNAECDRLSQQLSVLRREFQAKDDSLQDEKYSLENEVSRLNKKISEQKASYNELEVLKEEMSMENKNLLLEIEELRGRVGEKDSELISAKESLETKQAELEAQVADLQKVSETKDQQLSEARSEISNLNSKIESLSQSLEEKDGEIATLKTENEAISQLTEDVHSKQIIIGKLRHEAIILNEHLTKSLSMLKQKSGESEETVDKELVSNLIIKFLQIPRGDTKKFEALSLIGGLLNWDEQRKVQAGLLHNTGDKNNGERPARNSFISMWTEFLDKESTKK